RDFFLDDAGATAFKLGDACTQALVLLAALIELTAQIVQLILEFLVAGPEFVAGGIGLGKLGLKVTQLIVVDHVADKTTDGGTGRGTNECAFRRTQKTVIVCPDPPGGGTDDGAAGHEFLSRRTADKARGQQDQDS